MDEVVNSDECNINPAILNHINKVDSQFYGSVIPFIQTYINCYITGIADENNNFIDYEYQSSSRKLEPRAELNNERYPDTVYALKKIENLLDDTQLNTEIGTMVETKVISKKDLKSLRKVAKVENVDMSKFNIPTDEE